MANSLTFCEIAKEHAFFADFDGEVMGLLPVLSTPDDWEQFDEREWEMYLRLYLHTLSVEKVKELRRGAGNKCRNLSATLLDKYLRFEAIARYSDTRREINNAIEKRLNKLRNCDGDTQIAHTLFNAATRCMFDWCEFTWSEVVLECAPFMDISTLLKMHRLASVGALSELRIDDVHKAVSKFVEKC